MRHAITLCSIALASFLTAPTGAHARSICDLAPTDVFEGVAVVTAVRHMPDQTLDYSPDYEVSRDLTQQDGTPVSEQPLGPARQALYHVDCAIGQDTVFTVTNFESEDYVTVIIEYFFNGRPIFTHGHTIRPGKIAKLSAANALAHH